MPDAPDVADASGTESKRNDWWKARTSVVVPTRTLASGTESKGTTGGSTSENDIERVADEVGDGVERNDWWKRLGAGEQAVEP